MVQSELSPASTTLCSAPSPKWRLSSDKFSLSLVVSYLPPDREEGFSLEASVACCDITPLELHTLLALWIVIYCCFILHQMNF